ncbi:J domain-containing protein [Rhodotorula paludigena]|uniref:J domain-containing protein n=1 Tax=Rhodotorula paludigena TaxID=86838 RepID=UPI00318265C8
MVANREEALRALSIAQKRLDAGQYDSAIRFAKKSIALEATAEARALLARAEQLERDGAGSPGGSAEPAPSASTSATSAGPSSASTTSRAKGAAKAESADTGSAKQYTSAQLAVVKRVKACRVTAYYEILELEKSCSENDVKKAYRKLALSLHPDKNLAPGAEEAFKMVSKAFQVLSDSNKRAIFDQTGGDPDSRGGGGGGGGGGFARGPAGAGFGGQGFGGEEVSPEDLFRMFFGGQGGGFGGAQFGGSPFGAFGGGPFGGGTTFQFYGPGGARMGGMPRAGAGRPANGQQQQQSSAWVQLAPLLIFFAFSLLSQLPSFFGSSGPADPAYSFEQTPQFSVPRDTAAGTRYFVNPEQYAAHPQYSSLLSANPSLGFSSSHPPNSPLYRRDLVEHLRASQATAEPVAGSGGAAPAHEDHEAAAQAQEQKAKKPARLNVPRDVQKFEAKVNEAWVNRLQYLCRVEMNRRNDEVEQARGFLGIGTDHARLDRALKQRLPHCEELSKVPGYRTSYR